VVNPERIGTKFAARHTFTIPAGQNVRLDLVLSAHPLATPFTRSEVVFSTRQGEANVFFHELLPDASPEDHRILRQALAGMIWCKQFFHYDVEECFTAIGSRRRRAVNTAATASGSISRRET
jgi:hypothetical protein